MTDWIWVKEKLPEFRQQVLVYMAGKKNSEYMIDNWVPRIAIGQLVRYDETDAVWYTTWGDGCQEGHIVTHWMPLPEEPQIVEGVGYGKTIKSTRKTKGDGVFGKVTRNP